MSTGGLNQRAVSPCTFFCVSHTLSDLGQVVELLVEQADLGPRHGVVHRGAALAPGVDDDAEGGARGDDGVGPQSVLDVEGLLDVGVCVVPVVKFDNLSD